MFYIKVPYLSILMSVEVLVTTEEGSSVLQSGCVSEEGVKMGFLKLASDFIPLFTSLNLTRELIMLLTFA